MRVCGFTIIRNAQRFDYPIVEAIRSVLPVVDEFVVLVGNSDDDTRKVIESIGSSKIRIYDSVWDDSLRKGGQVLAVETDKAMDLIGPGFDWAFYIQADEVIHEKYHPAILEAMNRWKNDAQVEGLLFDYVHFYGDYNYIGDSRKWYRAEIRIVRPNIGIHSWKDAQGFRKENRKLNVRKIEASVFHYGWVKPPEKQQAKQQYFHKLWHDDRWMEENIPDQPQFDYLGIDSVAIFTGTHPEPMKKRVLAQSWKVEIDPSKKKLSFRYKFLMLIERITGWRPGEYKNYQRID
jgi:glycosyltransferase involved in cell wall biosynthesis